MFVTKKRFNKIVEKIDRLEKQSNCDHVNIAFVNSLHFGIMYDFRKECVDCGKILKKYDNTEDWSEEKAMYKNKKAIYKHKKAKREYDVMDNAR